MKTGRPRKYDWCMEPGCHREHYARGYCQAHYRRLMRLGALVPVQTNSCTVAHCNAGRMEDQDMCIAHLLESNWHDQGRPEEWLK